MKRLIDRYRRWRRRRLYRKLFLLYAGQDPIAYNAHVQASEAFIYITGEEYQG